jgi:hypothetical protein
MFWFAGAARASVHWIVPVLSGVPVGAGMTLLQLSLANYYIDLYPTRSASALAGSVTCRNLLGTVFPVIATPLYHALGNQCVSLLLAGTACAGIPAGVVLVKAGRGIRRRSRCADKKDLDVPAAPEVQEKTAAEREDGEMRAMTTPIQDGEQDVRAARKDGEEETASQRERRTAQPEPEMRGVGGEAEI